jgi:SAM-dependent methyltransferase
MIPDVLQSNASLFACPACRGKLEINSTRIACTSCARVFSFDEAGIPELFWANDWDHAKPDVTEAMRGFYEEHPFPNYDDLDSAAALREKAEHGVFAKLLDEQIGFGAKILEVGCGTGQLSNFLATTWGRVVIGADVCMNSLQLAHKFKQDNRINSALFVQMNLFKPPFRPNAFDVVICNGVLHHTSDPFLGFRTISNLVKVGGHCVIGLYNKYGRLTTDVRRFLFRISGDRLKFLDARMRDKRASELRKKTWFMDQYKNPHESKHTFGEVLGWFDAAGIEFTNSIPKSTGDSFSQDEKLFKPQPRGTKFDHFMIQLGDLLTGGRDGGFFVMIGRRTAPDARP